MKVLLTGGSGFIGAKVGVKLRQRGHEVVAYVRNRARAIELVGAGCEVIEGDLMSAIGLEAAAEGCEAAFHLGAQFEIGVKKEKCPDMQDVNIGGTRRLIDAAQRVGMTKVIYASTINVFGNTNKAVVDETFKRNPIAGFLSCYDESKYRAHQLVQNRVDAGHPIVMVQPGLVYGPGDHFSTGHQLSLAATGQLHRFTLANFGVSMTYIDDAAEAFLLAFEKGTIGQSYIAGGENVYFKDALIRTCELAGYKPPKASVPPALLNALSPLGWFIGPKIGASPNFKEIVRAGNDVTYWANDAKARMMLGYSPRTLDEGLATIVETEKARLA